MNTMQIATSGLTDKALDYAVALGVNVASKLVELEQ